MTEAIFLDTNFIIDFLKGNISQETSTKLLANKTVKICVLVEYELRLGQEIAQSKSYKVAAQQFLEFAIIIPITSEITRKASEIQAKQMKKGERIPIMDLLIGATALVNNTPIITNDKHFEKLIAWNLQLIIPK